MFSFTLMNTPKIKACLAALTRRFFKLPLLTINEKLFQDSFRIRTLLPKKETNQAFYIVENIE